MKGSNSKVVQLEARELSVHPFAQRALLPSKLKQLKAEMDLDAVGVLHAVRYEIDGQMGYWVIDGQHRLRSLMDLGLGEWVVEVKVHLDATDHERASALFLKLNNRAAVSPYDKYENELRSGCAWAIRATEIAQRYGLRISRSSSDKSLNCPSVVRAVYGMDGGKSLDAALCVICSAWGHRQAAMEGKLVEGIGIVMNKYADVIDKAVLIKKLAKFNGGPSALIGDAKTATKVVKSTVSRAVASQVIAVYNSGRRSGALDPL